MRSVRWLNILQEAQQQNVRASQPKPQVLHTFMHELSSHRTVHKGVLNMSHSSPHPKNSYYVWKEKEYDCQSASHLQHIVYI